MKGKWQLTCKMRYTEKLKEDIVSLPSSNNINPLIAKGVHTSQCAVLLCEMKAGVVPRRQPS